jgi:hypothetical protein
MQSKPCQWAGLIGHGGGGGMQMARYMLCLRWRGDGHSIGGEPFTGLGIGVNGSGANAATIGLLRKGGQRTVAGAPHVGVPAGAAAAIFPGL